MQVTAAEFIAVIIALAGGCVMAIGLAWHWHREFHLCNARLKSALEDADLMRVEIARLQVIADSVKPTGPAPRAEPINYPPSRYVA